MRNLKKTRSFASFASSFLFWGGGLTKGSNRGEV